MGKFLLLPFDAGLIEPIFLDYESQKGTQDPEKPQQILVEQ